MSDFDPEHPCRGCPVECKKRKSQAKLRRGTPFLVVGKSPSMESLRLGEILPAEAHRALVSSMSAAGITPDSISWANAVRCNYDETKYPTKVRKEIEKRCRTYLLQVIEALKPEVVVPLGAAAAKQVYGRPVRITKVRGVVNWSDELGSYIMAMTDPVLVNMYPQHRAIMDSDAAALSQAYQYEYDKDAIQSAKSGNYELVDDLQFLIDEDPPELVFDCETQGTRPYLPDTKLLTMQFCPEPGRAYILSWDHPDRPMPRRRRARIKQQIRELLCKPGRSIVGQNLSYDLGWTMSRLGIQFRIDQDTLMLAAMHDENLQTKDLDTLTKIYVPELAGYADAFNATYDKENMQDVPLQEIVFYGCADTDATLRVYHALRPLVEADERLWRSYRYVAIPGINAFCSFQLDGKLIDEDALVELESVLEEQLEHDFNRLIYQVPRAVKWAHVLAGKELSFTRPDFVRDILFTHPKGLRLTPKEYTKTTKNLSPELQVPSISTKDHLPYFYEDHQFVYELAEYIKTSRLLGTNIKRFREKYIHEGRIYPTYNLHTAVTGRTASRDPNSQNEPKRGKAAKAYRRVFIAPPGYVQLQCDLSQAEIRIAADMANDRTLLEIFRNNGDVHARTACIVMGVTPEQFSTLPAEERALARFKAKAVVFGYLYGMGWRKFVGYARTQYGVRFTDKEAQRIRNQFFATYSGLAPWHRGMKEFAQEHGFVRSYDGRIRHLPTVWSDTEYIQQEALRQAINSPVQCFASNLGVMSMARISTQIDPQYLRLNGFVHDAIYVLVPERYTEWGAKTLKYYMESNPVEEWFGRSMRVPIKADVGFGLNGRDMHEMELLDLDQPYDFSVHADEMDFTLPLQEIPPDNGLYELPEHLKAPEQIHLWD